MIDWITVDGTYLDHLRANVDSRIPHTNYGANHYKPFFGILFEVDGCSYVAAVSHPQPKHLARKASQDFIKIYDGDKLLCVVNLNYMFPVQMKNAQALEYSNISALRTFSSETEKNNYIGLLKKEIRLIRSAGIEKKAQKLYAICTDHPEAAIVKRCLDFKALELACKEYNA